MERERAPAVGRQAGVAHDGAVAAVEALGQPQQVGQRADRLAVGLVEVSVGGEAHARRGLAMKQRRRRHDGDLALIEAEQIGVGDQVGRVHVVVGVRDEGADVVQQGSVVEQLALRARRARGYPASRELSKSSSARRATWRAWASSAPQARTSRRTLRSRTVSSWTRAACGLRDEIVHEQPVAQPALGEGGHGGQREVGHQRLEHDRAGDDDVGAVGVEARHPAALVERQAAQQLDHLAHVGEARRLVALGLAAVQHPGGDRRHVAHRARGAVGDVDVEPRTVATACTDARRTARCRR